MTKREYLLYCFKHTTVWKKAEWVFGIFTVVSQDDEILTKDLYPYKVAVVEGKYSYYTEDATWTPITDAPPPTQPLYQILEGITINGREELIQACQTYPTKVSVGNLFINHYTLVHAFGDFFPLQLGKLSIGDLEKMCIPYIVDNDKVEPGKITVREMKEFITACSSVSGFAGIANASATPTTMVPSKGIREYRDSLLAKYKDRLNDPLVIAEIDRLLEEYDRNFQNSDPDAGFYIARKAFAVSRKRVHSMVGTESSEVAAPSLVTTSLSEGWKVKDFRAYNNTLRSGSYARGASTALGGAAVKDIFRVFAVAMIESEDCGTKLGYRVTLTEGRAWKYFDRYIIDHKGYTVLLTKENYKEYIGREVMIRSPGYCRHEGASYCQKCMGEKIRGTNSLAAEASNIGSRMLDISMALMHGRATEVIPWDINKALS